MLMRSPNPIVQSRLCCLLGRLEWMAIKYGCACYNLIWFWTIFLSIPIIFVSDSLTKSHRKYCHWYWWADTDCYWLRSIGCLSKPPFSSQKQHSERSSLDNVQHHCWASGSDPASCRPRSRALSHWYSEKGKQSLYLLCWAFSYYFSELKRSAFTFTGGFQISEGSCVGCDKLHKWWNNRPDCVPCSSWCSWTPTESSLN